MSDKKPSPPVRPVADGHQPSQRGHQPTMTTPSNIGNVQGGHQPTTGQGGNGSPPNQGSGGKK